MRSPAGKFSRIVIQYWPSAVTLLVSTAVYLFTLAPDLTWANSSGDGGELIAASYTLGIPHPPGYPTYTLIGKAFSYLPLRTVAWRYNLFSAVAMALAAALVTATVVTLLEQRSPRSLAERTSRAIPGRKSNLAAVLAGLFFAFSPLVWQQAVVTEVYALNALFVSLVLLVTVRSLVVTNDPPTQLILFNVGLLLGLAVTTHLTSLLLLPLILLLIGRHGLPLFFAGMAAGLLPFLALPALSQSDSPVSWGEPDTWRGWWWLVSARLYRPNVLALPVSDWGPRLIQWVVATLGSFGWIALPFVLIGINDFWRTDRRKVLVAMLFTMVLFGLYAFSYRTNDAHVFFLPGVLLLSVVLGFGVGSHPRLGLSLLLLLVALNLPSQRPGATDNVRLSAEQTLQQVPFEAIVLTPGDQTIATLWYFHHVEGQRPDLIIIDGNLFQFDWYREQLEIAYPELRHLAEDDLDGFRQLNSRWRPVCDLSLVNPEINQCLYEKQPEF